MQKVLKNGMVYQNNQFVNADVLIADGKIKAVGKINVPDAEIIDVAGQYVFPGLVDVHVHYRDPGLTYKEDVYTGTMAAAHGGFTTTCAMANVDPVPNTPELIKQMIAHNEEMGVVHVKQFAPITADLVSDDLIDYQAMKDAGVCGFSNDGHGVQHGGTMYQAMQGIKAAGLPLAEHVEDDTLKFNGVMNEGANAEKLGLMGIPGMCETSQLARDLALAEKTGVHYHMCHVSTKESVELIRIAKAAGTNVTCEVAPHHLLLNDSMITTDDGYYKMNPPLRTSEDQEALLEGLLDGTIDMIATDHAPHADDEKLHGMAKAAFGITGSETAFSTLYTQFVKTGKCSLTKLIEWMAINPARLFNLNEAGMLKIGDAADIAVFDLEHPFKFEEKDYLSKGRNTPFTQKELYGQTVLTLADGEIKYQREKEL